MNKYIKVMELNKKGNYVKGFRMGQNKALGIKKACISVHILDFDELALFVLARSRHWFARTERCIGCVQMV